MLEGAITLMTCRALPGILVAQIDRVLEDSARRCRNFSPEGLVERRMADAALVSNDLALRAKVLTVVAAETALGVVVADIVRVSSPVRLHLRKEIGLVDSLDFRDRI